MPIDDWTKLSVKQRAPTIWKVDIQLKSVTIQLADKVVHYLNIHKINCTIQVGDTDLPDNLMFPLNRCLFGSLLDEVLGWKN